MSNTTNKVVCGKHFSCKKRVFDQCGVCRYFVAHPYCQSKIKHKDFGIQIQSKNEQKKRKFNRATIYRGRDRMNLIYELALCGDGIILSNKNKLLTIGNLFGVEAKTCNMIPNKAWNVADR